MSGSVETPESNDRRQQGRAPATRGGAGESGAGVGAVLAGTAASFGLVISSGLLSVVVAGTLQWVNLAHWLDDGIPLAILAGGLLLSGRVATDVAGHLGVLCALGAAVLVGLVGTAVGRAGEAHGDGVEAGQIAVAVAVVLVLTGGSALWVDRRRSRHRRPTG